MNRNVIARVLAGFMVIAVSNAGAVEPSSPIEKFHEETTGKLLICKIQVKIALTKVQLGTEMNEAFADAYTCIKDGRVEVKKLFTTANARLQKKPAASKLLKDYFAAWLTAFNGLLPQPNELKVVFEQRQIAAEGKADEIWNRFEVEAGI